MYPEDDTLLEGDILPAQFADMLRAKELLPEKRLMLAILEDAFWCYHGDGSAWNTQTHGQIKQKKTQLQQQANQWFFGDEPSTPWHVSVQDCCNALNLNLEAVRRRLRAPSSEQIKHRHVVSHRAPRRDLKLFTRDEVIA